MPSSPATRGRCSGFRMRCDDLMRTRHCTSAYAKSACCLQSMFGFARIRHHHAFFTSNEGAMQRVSDALPRGSFPCGHIRIITLYNAGKMRTGRQPFTTEPRGFSCNQALAKLVAAVEEAKFTNARPLQRSVPNSEGTYKKSMSFENPMDVMILASTTWLMFCDRFCNNSVETSLSGVAAVAAAFAAASAFSAAACPRLFNALTLTWCSADPVSSLLLMILRQHG
eukprot:CAMPEP_0172936376 /NCGR_PEP_ID=MMETSP1075-20121228/221989_1 /TAXON_ID=2916 /ORGANISM="Ceratium fusus, Strain PA161109" /LENGTH=224 /DNA_ID=CAMNT_0013797747 /DNA_START=323 /DNA_END=998 /DNA_ORIENTATION=-